MDKQPNGRRKFLTGLSALSVGSMLLGYKALSNNAYSRPVKPKPKPTARMGINLSGIAYWSSEFPFVNLMHQSGNWVSQPPSGDWGKGPNLMLDEYGWVKKLEKGCRATKIICSGGEVEYPSGAYVVLYDGEGELALNVSVGNITKKAKGRLEIEVDSTKGMLAIDIISTNPKNHLRNVRVITPGFESHYQENPWHPDFLKRWSGVACLRFMDMMKTNNAEQVHWEESAHLDDATYAEKAVPVELLVDLANRLNADAWFCMPHQANNAYIKQFASVVKQHLKPHLRAWVEYSNEVWNGGFKQYRYAEMQGQALKLADSPWEAAFRYYAKRSVDVFNIWETVFGGRDHFVSVIASQAANVNLSDQILAVGNIAELIDVLAVAPYITLNVPAKQNEAGLSAKKVSAWSLDKLFEYIHTVTLPTSKRWIDGNKKIADKYSVKLVAYEAGQHLVGIGDAVNNNQLTELLVKANGDKRMGGVYTKYLAHWQAAGGDLICMYNSIGGWSKWGSWGLLQSAHESASGAPKFKAVMNWAKSRGQKVSD